MFRAILFSKVIVNSPWYYFVLSLLFALLLSYILYFRNKKNSEVPKSALMLMAGLRFVYLTLLCFLLLSILFRQLKTETEKPSILLAIDNSLSMVAGADSAQLKKEIPARLEKLKEALQDKYLVKTLLFGDKVRSQEALPDFSEKETDLEQLVREVDNNYANQNIGALVLLSDGIFNKGANPVYAAEKLGYPVYSIAMGDTNQRKDALIVKVNHNQVAYLGNNFPVEVVVQAKKLPRTNMQLHLFENGIKKSEQNIVVTNEHFTGTYNFTLNAGSTGIVKYSARLSLVEGDKNADNNQVDFLVEVIDNKEKVLLLANSPHPDVAAIKESILNTTAYDLSYGYINEFKGNVKAYTLVILHGYSAANQALLKACEDNAVSYWLVAPTSPDYLPGLKLTGHLNRYNDTEARIENAFGLFGLSNELKSFVNDLPAVKTFFGNYSLSNGSHVLLQQKIGSLQTDDPLMYFSETNGLKSAVFLGDGLWKWKMRDFAEHQQHKLFDELLSKTLQYLSVKSDKSFFRVNAPKIVNENLRVELQAEVYNKSYELITDPDVSLVLKNADNKNFNYTFSKTNRAYALDLGMLAPGEYQYEARVNLNGELLTKKGRFVVKEVLGEKTNLVADHQLLFQLAHRSKGQMFNLTQTETLAKELLSNENIKPIVYTQTRVASSIDVKWLFWLLILMFAAEWFFRKRYLTI